MKRVTLSRLRLVNFKGVANLEVDFSDTITTISGRNGSGKTTIFDAFVWLLFGKDSQDRKQFSIRTIDKDGNIIPKLPHEVYGELVVNGEIVTLRRKFVEKWVKKRGSVSEEYTGNEEERYYNEVPCSLTEYNAKIAEICPENMFKFITNPLYFTSQKPDVQRAMLFQMAGNVNDEDIARGNEEFEALLKSLTGKTLEEYKKEIAAKKRNIKDDIKDIPGRIDERKRSMPKDEDWETLNAELDALNKELADVERKMTDRTSVLTEASNKRVRELSELQAKKEELAKRENLVRDVVYREDRKVMAEYETAMTARNMVVARLEQYKAQKESLIEQQNSLTEQRSKLLAEYHAINARQLTFGQNDFVCPTCHRPLDVADIEAKQAEMTEAFNTGKAEAIADNIKRGKAVASQRDMVANQLTELNNRIAETMNQLAAEPVKPALQDVEKNVDEDEQVIKLREFIRTTEIRMAKEPITTIDTSDLRPLKQQLTEQIDAVKARLAKREVIEQAEERIEELETQLRSQSQELANLEGIEFVMQRFSKARVEAIEGRINGMFQMVRFKMFAQQINGGEVETCEAVVNGTPFSTLNKAMTINAGIDIINAICHHCGITAPIFVDNSEAINEILPTDSQLIRLVVSEEPKLTIH